MIGPSEPRESAAALEQLAAQVRDALDADALDEVARALNESLMMIDVDRVEATLRRHIELASRWSEVLQTTLLQAEEAERTARRWRFDPASWDEQRDALAAKCVEDPDGALAEWIALYADALAHWELAYCERIAMEPFPLPAHAESLHTLLQTATGAIREERFADAEGLLEYLVEVDHPDVPALADGTRALLLVMLGRIEIYDVDQRDEALAHLTEAAELAPGDGRTRAALGDYCRDAGDLDEARRLYTEAREISPGDPQGAVGVGLCAEAQEWWDEADDWYAQAMPPLTTAADAYDFRRALCALRAPVSGNVYLELARTMRRVDPEAALDALDRAILLGINQTGNWPERVAHKLRGSVLESLGRDDEAAAALFEAGWRFYSAGDLAVAVECLQQADVLRPNDADTLRYLADSLFVLSQRDEAPYVDLPLLERALATSDDAFAAAGAPDADSSWTYVSRARMLDRLGLVRHDDRIELIWQAVAFTERALVLNDRDSFRWAMLAQFFRGLELQMNAADASRRALEFDPGDSSGLEELAAAEANLGRLAEAEELIERRRALGTYAWPDAVKAFTLLYRRRAEEALPLLDGVVAAVPNDIWYRELRAVCHELLGDDEGAEADNRAICERRDEKLSAADRRSVAGAASFLGEHDEALAILEELLDEPTGLAETHRGIAIDRMAVGDLEYAARELALVIDHSASPLLPRSMAEIDLPAVVRRTGNRADHEEIARFAESWVAPMLRRAEDVEPPSPDAELEGAAAELKATTSWAWVGTQAALARRHRNAGRHDQADAIYRTLADDARFPEARTALGATPEQVV